MRQMTAWRESVRLIDRVWVAEHAAERMRGLLGRPPLDDDEAMLITPCRLVHTFGMAYAIDLVFLDRAGRVRKTVSDLPARHLVGSLSAHTTLELRAGRVRALGIATGQTLEFRGA